MNKIQMVDLKSQYQKIKSEIDSSIQQVIDSTAFINCPAKIIVDKGNPNFVEFDGVIYNKDLTKIVYVPQSIIEVVLPRTIENISYAFCNSDIKKIFFDEETSITNIGASSDFDSEHFDLIYASGNG